MHRHGYELQNIREGHGAMRYRSGPTRDIDSAYAMLTAEQFQWGGKKKTLLFDWNNRVFWLRG